METRQLKTLTKPAPSGSPFRGRQLAAVLRVIPIAKSAVKVGRLCKTYKVTTVVNFLFYYNLPYRY
jgi:hypothetical protein